MRAIKLGIGLFLLWALYWIVAGWMLQSNVSQWFDAQAARGWQADYADLSLSGFPGRHITTITAPALADPATGAAWRADSLQIDSRAIWPGHVTVRFADAPQLLSYFDRTLTYLADTLMADLRLQPGFALELQQMSVTSGPWSVTGEEGGLFAAASLVLATEQQENPNVYSITARAEGFAPGERLRRVAQISRTLPERFETLDLNATITWDKPWDRSAVETARPQPRHVKLSLADAKWGALRLKAAGDFTVDPEGIPEGTINIRAENWRDMLAMAQRAGVLPREAIGPLERTLTMLEGLGGSPNALDLRLNLRGGAVAVGPIPLGPAPRLILR